VEIRSLGQFPAFHSRFEQSAETTDEGNASQKKCQPDQKAEKRSPDSPDETQRSKAVMLSLFEGQCSDQPDREEQKDPQAAPNNHTRDKSREIAKAPEGCRGKFRDQKTHHEAQEDCGQAYSAAKKSGTPSSPRLPDDKNEADKEESRLPER
jgi:hypothetical protein